ncbi:CocE/NonD family hydrolase [Conexibacter sp. DBS9H8]|uniref:CocE/NonD family hydrolase n=1 Tax=Conexibacter sp. DBS9H8 TaxID=2937801 RepID=UPI00200BDDD2|nr:CocE/NonD family hydrolase [Conexibacter sp. DBS9H8]
MVGLALMGALLTMSSASAAPTRTGLTPRTRPAHAAIVAHSSAEQVYLTGLAPRARMELLNRRGRRVQVKRADAQGGLIFYGVRPGRGYRVRGLARRAGTSAPVTVYSDASAPWDPGIYHQTIKDSGYQYLTVRDGVQLAIDVHPPPTPAGLGLPTLTLPGALPDYAPPYPTLIEYSGYGYADPAGPQNGIAAIANLMGFAVVDVNMRGTGCSGGAYNFFEPLQNLDAYDVIETIAHQPWVLGHKVGMLGISYGAISQLFAAQTDPPDLEAIAPLSTIDATATTLYPGGILNTGFAVAWANQRQADAEPALNSHYDQGWAWKQIASGDAICKANQALHGEAENLPKTIRANSHFIPRFANPLDPITFVHKIHVPVFMACQFTDEQTGAHCPALVAHFTGTSQKWFTFTNGVHGDSLDPVTLNHLFDFYSLFVAHRAPQLNAPLLRSSAPLIYQTAFGTPNNDPITLPPDPIQNDPTEASAMAAFTALPEVTVLFDNGAGASPNGSFTPGNPYPGFSAGFPTLPVPGTVPAFFYLGPGGSLNTAPPTAPGVDTYTSNAHALSLNDFINGPNSEAGGLWGDAAQWHWDWQQNPAGSAVSYLSQPLLHNTTVIGAGAVHLWVRSSARDVDLQATISEVDPDGTETFVQNGWLRASERALSRGTNNELAQRSTLLQPIPAFTKAAAAPMPAHRFVEVVIPLYWEGHVYRAGTRIRVTIAAPNGTQPVWSFSQTVGNGAKVAVRFAPKMPSSLILPVVPGVAVPTPLPPCPSLRNEPCRTYVPFHNAGA